MVSYESIKKLVEALNVFSQSSVAMISCMIQAFLITKKLRISSIANGMRGNFESNYKSIQRFLKKQSLGELGHALLSFVLVRSEAVFIDYTDIERKDAKHTSYVGILKDGKTRGFGILTLSTPYKGRSLPFAAQEYSSAIINNEISSKTIHLRDFLSTIINALLGKIIVGDREFCNQENFQFFEFHQLSYAIRLKVGGERSKTIITNQFRKKLNYSLQKGEKKTWRNVFYRGKIRVNLIGIWDSKFNEPLYIITNCEPKKALDLYKMRMKIEETFKDVKDKLGFTKIMSKSIESLIKLLLMGFLAYAFMVLVGEWLRKSICNARQRKKFSGLHILLEKIYLYTHHKLKKAIKFVVKLLQQMLTNSKLLNPIYRSVEA